MSGSGGTRGDLSFGGSGSGGTSDSCLKNWRGVINSPKPDVISKLSVGSILEVKTITVGSSPILIVEYQGHQAGSLTFSGYVQLIACITDRGISYTAEVIKLSGGICEVEISPNV